MTSANLRVRYRSGIGRIALAGADADLGMIRGVTESLHVLCAEQGAHPSLASGFMILSFDDLGEPDMAYVEHALGATHLEKEPAVTLARVKFDQLRSRALGQAESQEVIRRVAGEM